jgi:hypothetical protein
MSFGLVNAPSTFQRMMDQVLAGLKWDCVQVYLDDIMISSASFEQHLLDITKALTRLREANLKLKSTKCFFCCVEVEYLGHLITRDGVRANPAKVKMITDWGIPKSASNLLSFLGLAGYYRKLVNNFATREAPLRRLIKKASKSPKEEFVMNEEALNAFSDLQQALAKDVVLAIPDFSGKSKFELQTDASDEGICAILCQIDEHGVERVIQYASRMLTKAELKWHCQEKEALAIIYRVKKFRSYLLGSHFDIKTDHQSLQWLWRSQKGKLARWALALTEFDYTIKHRPGIHNANADAGSRWTTEPADEDWSAFPDYADPLILTRNAKDNEHEKRVMRISKMVKNPSRTFIDIKNALKSPKG